MIKGHGDDSLQYLQTIRADFSSNVLFGGTPHELIIHLRQNLHLIENYPEPDAAELCRKIAKFHEVIPDQVLAFNGSVEAFYTIALAFRTSISAILYPAFSEYGDACQLHMHTPLLFKQDESESVLKSGVKLFWIGNPNNPDGIIFSIQEIIRWLEQFQDTIFVIDEAYAAITLGFLSAIPLTKNHSNLIVVRSLTKCCTIPGLRLGYAVTSDEIAKRLRIFQQPWSVNALAQEAGKFLIEHLHDDPLELHYIQQLSIDLQHSVNQLSDYQVIPAKTPFFLVKMQMGDAAGLKQFLISELGILIREAGNFRGLGSDYFRVCTRNESDNQLLVEGLKKYSEMIMADFAGLKKKIPIK